MPSVFRKCKYVFKQTGRLVMFTYYWWQISSDDSDRENSGEKNSNEENIYIYIWEIIINFLILQATTFYFLKYKKILFFKLYKKRFFRKNISFWLESYISQNITKTFLRKYEKFVYSRFLFNFWAWDENCTRYPYI